MEDKVQDAALLKNGKGNGQKDKLSLRNLIMFPLGGIGRDFLYALFNGWLLNFILFTKDVTDAQFASVSIIIICARIFDAFNDPFMGGIVENTRTKWGKFKPWILIGALLTGFVVIAVFSVPLDGWAYIGFLAAMYFLFSITYTMNDISYWGMLPSLTSNEHDRGKLTSFTQIFTSAGSGLVGIIVPVLAFGPHAIGGSAVNGFMIFSIMAGVMMIGFQLFTLFGVKEKPLQKEFEKAPRMTLKQMFRILFSNKQLMWSALVMLIFNIGTNVVGGGLSLTYIFFEFGYRGELTMFFGVPFAVISVLFTLVYPWLVKKVGRVRLMYMTGFALIGGYLLMLLFGLVLPSNPWQLKFTVLTLCNGIVGFGQGFYTILLVYIADTVEYNEWTTGKRDEGLIFSIRPFTAKMGSALSQGLVMLVYLIVRVTKYTNQISVFENDAAKGLITDEAKALAIQGVITSVPGGRTMALLCCMCLIPVIFLIVAIIIYKKKCIIDEKFYNKMISDIEDKTSPAYMEIDCTIRSKYINEKFEILSLHGKIVEVVEGEIKDWQKVVN